LIPEAVEYYFLVLRKNLMRADGDISIIFTPDQKTADDVRFPIFLKRMIVQLSEDNMESLSSTVVSICSAMLNAGKRDTSKLQELILEYTLKKKLKNKSVAIRRICKEYFDKYPLRK
jgi:hypothetical protein